MQRSTCSSTGIPQKLNIRNDGREYCLKGCETHDEAGCAVADTAMLYAEESCASWMGAEMDSQLR
jgi:hypothetical protein